MTDKEKLEKMVAEIEKAYNEAQNRVKLAKDEYWEGKVDAYRNVLCIFDSMQEEPKSKFEQSIQEGDNIVYNEDLGCRVNLSQLDRVAKKEESVSEDNNLRKASEEYLKVLSETPYNNTPITNAQTIVRELITFLDNPSKYNPNHIEEPVSEDLKEAADNALESITDKYDIINVGSCLEMFRLGANWQKEQDEKEKSDIYDIAVDVGRKLGETDMKLQMMKEAIFCPVTKRDVGISLSITNRDVIKDTKDLSYLKVIIIKED